jgi:aldose sugar dehydrogenase
MKRNIIFIIAALLLLVVVIAVNISDNDNLSSNDDQRAEENYPVTSVTTETVLEGLSVPWGLAFLPDGSMLITEREGKLLRFSEGKTTEISGVPKVHARGQGGLLDIILHPDYENNGWIYFSYSAPGDNGSNTAIMRAKLNGNSLTDQQQIYLAQPHLGTNHHYGCKLIFGEDGYLYFSVGDRGTMKDAQDLTSHSGKIHRIKEDGSIPDDNPFLDEKSAVRSIFAYGSRNIQGITRHPQTQAIWTHEHGPQGGDEINIAKKGANYGWPEVTHGKNYDGTTITQFTEKPGMENPLHHWTPSIAPSGMAFIVGDKYPGWENNLLVGALRSQYLERIELNGEKIVAQHPLFKGIGRIRNVTLGPDGYIYLSLENPGKILRVIPES